MQIDLLSLKKSSIACVTSSTGTCHCFCTDSWYRQLNTVSPGEYQFKYLHAIWFEEHVPLNTRITLNMIRCLHFKMRMRMRTECVNSTFMSPILDVEGECVQWNAHGYSHTMEIVFSFFSKTNAKQTSYKHPSCPIIVECQTGTKSFFKSSIPTHFPYPTLLAHL